MDYGPIKNVENSHLQNKRQSQTLQTCKHFKTQMNLQIHFFYMYF